MCMASLNEVESEWNWICHRVSDGWHEKSSWLYFDWGKRASPPSSGIREVSRPRFGSIATRILRWKSATVAAELPPVYRARKKSSGLKLLLAFAVCRNE